MEHCIGTYEENRYHDSYFHGVFFNDETNEITTRMIGSTAFGGGCYDMPKTTDATVWAKVKAIKVAERVQRERDRRKAKAEKLLAIRATFRKNGVHTAFMNAYTLKELEEIAALFGSRIRNKFKLSMRENVKAWRPGNYRKPLSPKQFACIKRPRHDMYGRPNALARAEELDAMVAMAGAYRWRGVHFPKGV